MRPSVARVLPRHSFTKPLASRADLGRLMESRCWHTARQERAGRRSRKAPESAGRACRAELHCIVVRAAGVALLDAWPHLQAAVRLLVKAAHLGAAGARGAGPSCQQLCALASILLAPWHLFCALSVAGSHTAR